MVLDVTRALFPFALQRQAGTLCELIYLRNTMLPDGSANPNPIEQRVRARITDLTTDDIQRLQFKGITINEGNLVSLPYEVDPPYQVRYLGEIYTVVAYQISQGVTNMILPKVPIGFANVEALA